MSSSEKKSFQEEILHGMATVGLSYRGLAKEMKKDHQKVYYMLHVAKGVFIEDYERIMEILKSHGYRPVPLTMQSYASRNVANAADFLEELVWAMEDGILDFNERENLKRKLQVIKTFIERLEKELE